MMRLIIIGFILLPVAQAYQSLSQRQIPSLKMHRHNNRLSKKKTQQPIGEVHLQMASSETDTSSPKNLSFMTNVLYTVGASTSLLVSMTFFAVLAYQRDALMVSFFIGAIANGALSKVLKKILNQDRPSDSVDHTNIMLVAEKPSDKGMPSSHAMSLGFIGTFTMLSLEWTRLVLPLYIAISLYYRVQTKLHTNEQVAVGLVFGVAHGYIWRHFVDGNNPFGINIMEFVAHNFLNDQGILPVQLLIIPAMAGAVVVGSLERKISKFLNNKYNKRE